MRPSRDENIMRCETSQPPVSLRRRRRRRRRRGWFAFILITPALSSPPFHYIATLGVVCVVVCVCVVVKVCDLAFMFLSPLVTPGQPASNTIDNKDAAAAKQTTNSSIPSFSSIRSAISIKNSIGRISAGNSM